MEADNETTEARIVVKQLTEGDIISVPQYANDLEVTHCGELNGEANAFIGVEFADDAKKTSAQKSMVVNQHSGNVYLSAGTTDKGQVETIEIVAKADDEDDDEPEELIPADDVDGAIMHEVAQEYGMGAGAVKGALAFGAPECEDDVHSKADEAALEARRRATAKAAAEREAQDDLEIAEAVLEGGEYQYVTDDTPHVHTFRAEWSDDRSECTLHYRDGYTSVVSAESIADGLEAELVLVIDESDAEIEDDDGDDGDDEPAIEPVEEETDEDDLEALQKIDGIGPKKAATLLDAFGDLRGVSKRASGHTNAIAELPGFSEESARDLFDQMREANVYVGLSDLTGPAETEDESEDDADAFEWVDEDDLEPAAVADGGIAAEPEPVGEDEDDEPEPDLDLEIDRSVDVRNPEAAPEEIVQAVREAFEASIGYLIDTREISFHEPTGHEIARFDFNYPEIPASCVNDDAPAHAWVAPYRCRELVDAELRERLPEGYHAEAANNTATGVYRD